VIDAEHDLVKALERWVEEGIAPQRIIATHYVNNTPAQGVAFQRPLCPFPERGEYAGSGDPNDASNFQCVAYRNPHDRAARGRRRPTSRAAKRGGRTAVRPLAESVGPFDQIRRPTATKFSMLSTN
jgi:hypothetical protein